MPEHKPAISVPVRVVATDHHRPVGPPVELPTTAAIPATAKTVIVKKIRKVTPVSRSLTTEDRRRKMMWPVVTILMTFIVVGWATLLRHELTGGPTSTFFSDLSKLVQKYKPTRTSPTPQEKEIQSLQQQVFPQFNP